MKNTERFINREHSWLDFNERVLEEAADISVPIIERIRFLGIFSNNLDEFFQVRYATVKRIAQSGKTGKKVLGGSEAKDLLEEITSRVIELQSKSNNILNSIEKHLRKENIHFINEYEVLPEQESFLREYFLSNVSPELVTVILNKEKEQDFTDNTAFLVVKMEFEGINNESVDKQFAIIEILNVLDRFIVLPKINNIQYVMLVDDLIRYYFDKIFSFFNYKSIEGHMIKITRDSELDLEGDASKSYIEKITESVKDRMFNEPVRMVYDSCISNDTLSFMLKKLGLNLNGSIIPGGRYHHRRDYMKFPSLDRPDLLYPKQNFLTIPGLPLSKNILDSISKKDYMMFTPYHSFSYLVKFLREAALDPKVKKIKITIYRLSKSSQVISSLINAAKNGKKVFVQIELQARFDEKNNIQFATKLEAAGVQITFGIPGLKVHSKICVIEREENSKVKRYGFISTGNFNELTAKVYTDYTLFSADQRIMKEVNKVFNFIEVSYKLKKYKHLIVSPHYTFNAINRLIDNEIFLHNQGKKTGIKLKLNNITDYKMIDKLYHASQQGIKIQLIVRGVCCLIPGLEGLSENIEVISIVDRFLEHPRVMIFENNDDPKVFISSADFMTRNIYERVEVGCPIYDSEIKKQIIEIFSIAWNDNIKSRNVNHDNNPSKSNKTNKKRIRSQWEIHEYFKSLVVGSEN
ncbi:MAG: polyphosphate kinase 1 [Flavobacteriaceae bacterium]|nr:polyphosphate kinase 1 [Flavobacteriaceae bacterium]